MLDLTSRYTVSGFWKIEFENGKEYGDYLGTFRYIPDDGCTVTLTFKNKDIPEELRPRKRSVVEISRVVGLTNLGVCYLYDAFSLGSSGGSELTEYRIYANLVSFAIKSDQLLGETYTVYDLKSPDEQIFYEAEVHFSELFQWIEAMTINSMVNVEEYSFYKKCEKCGNVSLKEPYQNWTSVKITPDITIHFDIWSIVQVKTSGKEDEKPNIKIRIESQKKSLNDFKIIAWKLQNIFSIFFDSSPTITSIACIKDLYNETPLNDYSYEEHQLLFLKSENNKKLNNFFDAPAKFTSREQFNSMLINSYSLFDLIPDFFVGMQRINNDDYGMSLISLLKIIDSSYKILFDKKNLQIPKNEDLKCRLKSVLTIQKFTEKEIKNIIHGACSPTLKEKVMAIVDSAIANFSLEHPKNYEEIITKAVKLRNKESHGEIRKMFKAIGITYEEIEIAYIICRTAIYAQFLKMTGMDSDLISKTVYFYFMKRLRGRWTPIDYTRL